MSNTIHLLFIYIIFINHTYTLPSNNNTTSTCINYCEHGVCDAGDCRCHRFWTGDSCNECVRNYFGDNCESCPIDSHMRVCSSHGTCSDGRLGSGVCTCDDGWQSENCECPGVGSICSGHGECLNGICTCAEGWRGGSGKCSCRAGFTGNNCTECERGFYSENCRPCIDCGMGSCRDGKLGNGTCECRVGWNHSSTSESCTECSTNYYGHECKKCPTGENNEVCSGHGTCSDSIGGDGTCNCVNNWKRNETNGVCDECLDNRYGIDCSICRTDCANGNCSSGLRGNGACLCNKGWTINELGRCVVCSDGHFGQNCQECPGYTSKNGECSGHGKCDDGLSGSGSCSCTENWLFYPIVRQGFEGEDCSNCIKGYYIPVICGNLFGYPLEPYIVIIIIVLFALLFLFVVISGPKINRFKKLKEDSDALPVPELRYRPKITNKVKHQQRERELHLEERNLLFEKGKGVPPFKSPVSSRSGRDETSRSRKGKRENQLFDDSNGVNKQDFYDTNEENLQQTKTQQYQQQLPYNNNNNSVKIQPNNPFVPTNEPKKVQKINVNTQNNSGFLVSADPLRIQKSKRVQGGNVGNAVGNAVGQVQKQRGEYEEFGEEMEVISQSPREPKVQPQRQIPAHLKASPKQIKQLPYNPRLPPQSQSQQQQPQPPGMFLNRQQQPQYSQHQQQQHPQQQHPQQQRQPRQLLGKQVNRYNDDIV